MFVYVLASCLTIVTMAIELMVDDDGSGEVTCTEYGHVYTIGVRMPHNTPCAKPCWCGASGQKQCRDVICEYPACYDVTQSQKDECCPRCPNGKHVIRTAE
jgi:hypothetical protein